MLAITLGRVCLCCPRHMSTLYETFIDSWCLVLGRVSDNSEKDTAFRGICAVVAQNPAGILHVSAGKSSRVIFNHSASPLNLASPILQDMVLFCDAISAYEQPSPELNQDFYNVGHPLMMGVEMPSKWHLFLFSSSICIHLFSSSSSHRCCSS